MAEKEDLKALTQQVSALVGVLSRGGNLAGSATGGALLGGPPCGPIEASVRVLAAKVSMPAERAVTRGVQSAASVMDALKDGVMEGIVAMTASTDEATKARAPLLAAKLDELVHQGTAITVALVQSMLLSETANFRDASGFLSTRLATIVPRSPGDAGNDAFAEAMASFGAKKRKADDPATETHVAKFGGKGKSGVECPHCKRFGHDGDSCHQQQFKQILSAMTSMTKGAQPPG